MWLTVNYNPVAKHGWRHLTHAGVSWILLTKMRMKAFDGRRENVVFVEHKKMYILRILNIQLL